VSEENRPNSSLTPRVAKQAQFVLAALGDRGRLRFVQPVAASESAVIQITGARLAQRDIRHIVLMADCVIFGSPAAHIPISDVTGRILMQPSGSGFCLRHQGGAQAHVLHLGESVTLEGTRFALAAWSNTGGAA